MAEKICIQCGQPFSGAGNRALCSDRCIAARRAVTRRADSQLDRVQREDPERYARILALRAAWEIASQQMAREWDLSILAEDVDILGGRHDQDDR
jgi:hypothetical protein